MKPIVGPHDSECYRLTHPSGAELIVSRHGGHAISWKTANDVEQLYLSPDAEFCPGKAIRGGIPVIFPQFSDHGPFARHGFARKSLWEVDLEEEKFTLCDSVETLREWPHPFLLTLQFELSGADLKIHLAVENTGTKPFEFHAALHTYLSVTNFTKSVSIHGLEDAEFFNESTKAIEPTSTPNFGIEVDRAYLDQGHREVTLVDGDRSVLAAANSFPDVVVWNPGPDHGIGDLPEDGWSDFVCVEAAATDRLITLEAGERWEGWQILRASG